MLRDCRAKNVLGIPVIGSNEQGAVYLHFQLLADKTASADATNEPGHHIGTNLQGVVHGHPKVIANQTASADATH